MVDLLVRLFSLPEVNPLVDELHNQRIIIRIAFPAEAEIIAPWVREHFNGKWAAECLAALAHRPVTCVIATVLQPTLGSGVDPYDQQSEKLVGFACYDAVSKGMFGPEGVHPDYRGRGIGKALLLYCMHAMSKDGYAYAVIAWAGPIEFYKNTVGATLIQDSEPGIFRGPLVGE